MKGLLACAVFLVFTSHTAFDINLDDIRKNYQMAVSDKNVCRNMINSINSNTQDYVLLAYKGAFQTMWANHTYNPVSKYNTFIAGKKNIEKAVAFSPGNVEIIFIRYSIQKNIPEFLGYKSNMVHDEKFLKDNINSITSSELKKMVFAVLNS